MRVAKVAGFLDRVYDGGKAIWVVVRAAHRTRTLVGLLGMAILVRSLAVDVEPWFFWLLDSFPRGTTPLSRNPKR